MPRSRASGSASWRVRAASAWTQGRGRPGVGVRFATGERRRGVQHRHRSPVAPRSGQLALRSRRSHGIDHLARNRPPGAADFRRVRPPTTIEDGRLIAGRHPAPGGRRRRSRRLAACSLQASPSSSTSRRTVSSTRMRTSCRRRLVTCGPDPRLCPERGAARVRARRDRRGARRRRPRLRALLGRLRAHRGSSSGAGSCGTVRRQPTLSHGSPRRAVSAARRRSSNGCWSSTVPGARSLPGSP